MQRNIFVIFLILSGAAWAGSPNGQIIYRFQGGSDATHPAAALLLGDAAGDLYGTSPTGGGTAACAGGCGTVFELSPPSAPGGKWTENVLYRFQGAPDGATPQSALVSDAAGNLYGTTARGGVNCGSGCGTVFELSPPASPGASWTETVLYSFQGNPNGRGEGDAADPNGLVLGRAGNIFGMAYGGGFCRTDETGTYCYGGAFELERPSAPGAAWTEKILYLFRDPSGDPAGPVFDKLGNLYGTAPGGQYGYGGVFRLSPPARSGGKWTESSVYDFDGNDGAFAEPGLTFDKAGDLYGATMGSPGSSLPYGNVFKLTPTPSGPWAESTLYNFTPIANGYIGNAGLALGKNGHLYATAAEGGTADRGVVYDLVPPSAPGGAWTQNVIYSFTGGRDGFAPNGGLIFGKGGALYGTTVVGGNSGCENHNGCGTVFRILP